MAFLAPQKESKSLTWSTHLCTNWLLSTSSVSCPANAPFYFSLLPAQGFSTCCSAFLEHLPGLGYLASFSSSFRSWLPVFLSVNLHPENFGRVRFLCHVDSLNVSLELIITINKQLVNRMSLPFCLLGKILTDSSKSKLNTTKDHSKLNTKLNFLDPRWAK